MGIQGNIEGDDIYGAVGMTTGRSYKYGLKGGKKQSCDGNMQARRTQEYIVGRFIAPVMKRMIRRRCEA